MGVPLRSNIFMPGTSEQRHFARFPIQVAVLFSPSGNHFSQAFRDLFLRLDQLTAGDVVFFAVLDPPEDWKEAARERQWWRQYEAQIGGAGFSFDERVLVREIARLFGLTWNQLPALVAATDLWAGEFVTCPTSPWHIEKQLEGLTQLTRQWGQPNIGHIAHTITEITGWPAHYHPADDELRFRLGRLYGILETAAHGHFDLEKYRGMLQSELERVASTLGRARRFAVPVQHEQFVDNSAFDVLAEDAAGRMVVPATVAARVFERLRSHQEIQVAELLEEESLVMIETALTNGAFLEQLADDALGGIAPLRLMPRGTHQRDRADRIDFTPGAQGAWKAFELEVNFSIIQACRAARSVRMPDLFTRYDAALPKNQARVKTGTWNGRPVFRDINQPDRERQETGRHRFLALGDGLYVTKAMRGSPEELFDSVIVECIGDGLPEMVLDEWEKIHRIRNRGSHTEPLDRADYEAVLSAALSPDVLGVLEQIKQSLSTRRQA